MRLISHRGNLNGPNPECENHPNYIDYTLSLGYDVEVDLYFIGGSLFLGHDGPQYEITEEWLKARKDCLLVHCKNANALDYMVELDAPEYVPEFFWHENDQFALTSRMAVVVYPGRQIGPNSIVMKPELNNYTVGDCYAICSDYISKFKLCEYSSPEPLDSSAETSEQN